MAEHSDRAVVEILRYPARIAETNCHLVDDLLTLVRERGRQTGSRRSGRRSASRAYRASLADGLAIYPATAHLPCRPGGGIASRGMRSAVPSEALLRTRQARRWPSRTREIRAISAKIGTSP